jgi:hypothetical protein
MPSTSFTDSQIEICKKHVEAFREGTRITKPTTLKEAADEIIALTPGMKKKEKAEIQRVSNFYSSKSFSPY